MNYFNHHSFTVSALIVYVVITILLLRDGIQFLDLVALATTASVFVLSWILLRPGPSTLTTLEDFEKVLHSGEPTLIEFQSEYWLACIAIRPVVNRLETTLKGRLRVIRLNIHDPLGKNVGDLYDLNFTPTFIFFDAYGVAQWRSVGSLNQDRLRASVTSN